MGSMALVVGLVLPSDAADAQEQAVEVEIELTSATVREARVAENLHRVVADHDLEPWILTRRVRVETGVIPHSHPVLTLNTQSLGHDLVAAFLHEQLHWLEDASGETWDAAMADYRALFPDVPPSSEGGARDAESTYRHLLVCFLELQALSTAIGEERARSLLAGQRFYAWVYEQVLEDPRVGEVAARHGFDATRGAGVPE